MRLHDRYHLEHPDCGSRHIRDLQKDQGYPFSHKRVQCLMRAVDLTPHYTKCSLSLSNQAHMVYPCLLRGLAIYRPNQVWATDVTYIPKGSGFVYFLAIMDWYTHEVMLLRLSNTLDVSFCVAALEEAIEAHGTPEIFIAEQDTQFTDEDLPITIKHHGIRISMDIKDRWGDNVFVERLWRSVKYEELYLEACDSIADARSSLHRYFTFYNTEKRHQSVYRHKPVSLHYGPAARLAA